jgi:hypothetical protein
MIEATMTIIKPLIPEGNALARDIVTHITPIARIIIITKTRMITMSEEKEIMIMIKIIEKPEEEAEVKAPDLKIKEVAQNQQAVIVKEPTQLEEMVIDQQVVTEKPLIKIPIQSSKSRNMKVIKMKWLLRKTNQSAFASCFKNFPLEDLINITTSKKSCHLLM